MRSMLELRSPGRELYVLDRVGRVLGFPTGVLPWLLVRLTRACYILVTAEGGRGRGDIICYVEVVLVKEPHIRIFTAHRSPRFHSANIEAIGMLYALGSRGFL